MNQYPHLSRLGRLPRALLGCITFIVILIIALAVGHNPASWAAPVAQTPKQVTHLPMITSPLINGCDFYNYACKLNVDLEGGFVTYDWSPDGNTIAFNGKVDGVSGLYTVNEQGKNRHLLLQLSNIEFIRYSPDGTMIALIVSRRGSLSNTGPANGHILHDLYVYTLATGQLRSLTDITSDEFSNVAPNWAPNSSRLAFTRIQHSTTTGELTAGDIYTIQSDGSELTELTDTSLNEHLPTYSPDGTRIAYIVVKEGSNNPSIAVMEVNGDNATILTSAETLFANDPFWAPNGNSIFFFGATENSDWDIYKVSINGGDPVNLIHDSLQQSDAHISPDGKQILFVGQERTPEVVEIDFYTMNLDGSHLNKYRNPNGPDKYPSGGQWHPDGKRISYVNSLDGLDLFLLRVDAH